VRRSGWEGPAAAATALLAVAWLGWNLALLIEDMGGLYDEWGTDGYVTVAILEVVVMVLLGLAAIAAVTQWIGGLWALVAVAVPTLLYIALWPAIADEPLDVYYERLLEFSHDYLLALAAAALLVLISAALAVIGIVRHRRAPTPDR
jgi:hypothetical protein